VRFYEKKLTKRIDLEIHYKNRVVKVWTWYPYFSFLFKIDNQESKEGNVKGESPGENLEKILEFIAKEIGIDNDCLKKLKQKLTYLLAKMLEALLTNNS